VTLHHLDEATLNELLDGELEDGARGAAERHLAGCDECRGRLSALEGLFVALKRLPEVAPPAALASRLAADFRREALLAGPTAVGPPGLRRRLPIWLGAVLALEVVIAGIAAAFLWSLAGPSLAGPGRWLTLPGLAWPALPPLPLGEWLAAMLDRLPEVAAGLPLPAPVSAIQWLPVVALALVAWLVGNALMLRRPTQA
jgi:anti-sigma factor RsiW